MKKLLIILVCLATAFSAKAQFVQNNNDLNTDDKEHSVGEKGFNKIVAILSPASYKYSTQTSHGLERGSDLGIQGGIVYTRSQRVTNNPNDHFYCEFGAGFLYTQVMPFNEVFELQLYTLYVPLNADYRFELGGKSYGSLFLGPYLKYNFAGKLGDMTDIFGSGGVKRTQLGWHGGADISLGRFYFSLSYNSDFTDLLDFSATDYNVDNKVSGWTFGLGVVF
ncbi:MAG: hypothetical protein KBS94_08820 [Prevotella sp.]|nr:hypothetical protein [Candidatus Equicola faecalis]